MMTDIRPGAGDVLIRQFCFPEDYEAVYRLWANAGPGINLRRSDEPDEIARKLERDPDLFLIAEWNGKIIGTLLGGFDGRRGLVYHLAVEADFRGRGIASRLMEELEARLRSKSCLRTYLLVTPQNEEAMRFYEKRGWKRMELYAYGKDLV